MYRFTIRDVLWLTVVVALGVGWWADRRRLDAPLAKLARYERQEQVALERKQDEKRLRDLQWKLISMKAVRNGAPWPAGEKPTFTGKEMEEMRELADRLAREKQDYDCLANGGK